MEFDHKKLLQMIRDAHARVASAHPAGALEWLEQNQPDAVAFLKGKQAEIDALFEAERADDLLKAIQVWEKASLKAWGIFNDRPQVMER